ncbi:MAG: hypothetical protein DRQ55_15125 [Planctomycetota bacterium]|nr:MAG: hypothetical protein DRQ55_15125 [Planctomycetota bacterium]
MNAAIQPLQLLLISVAGWMGRRQQEVIEYLVEENRVLKQQRGGRRLRLSSDQRRRGQPDPCQADPPRVCASTVMRAFATTLPSISAVA